MRYLLTILLVAPLFACCTKREGGLVRDESDQPDYADYWQRELAEHSSPSEALRQADAYFNSLPFKQRSPHRNKVRVDFCGGFFSGFISSTGSIVGGEHDTHWHGFQAGQAYRRGYPAKLRETMEGFGYTATEAEGRWTVGFERSGFNPKDRAKGEEWWLTGLDETAFAFMRESKIPGGGISIRMTGYLSPKGQYGHLGAYDHEFYATQVSRTNGN